MKKKRRGDPEFLQRRIEQEKREREEQEEYYKAFIKQKHFQLGLEGLQVKADYLLAQSEILVRWAFQLSEYLSQKGHPAVPTPGVASELKRAVDDWKVRMDACEREMKASGLIGGTP